MKCVANVAFMILQVGVASAFVTPLPQASRTTLFSAPIKEDETKETTADNKIDGAATSDTPEVNPDADGLPWWWELVWKLDIMKKGEPGQATIFGDSANVLRTNIEQLYGGYPSLDRCPLAEGDITDIADGTMFIGLQTYQQNYGSPFKLCFGPKSFLVISDPIQAKHLLRDANTKYDKVRMNHQSARRTSVEVMYMESRNSSSNPILRFSFMQIGYSC
jgi:hypothetical protein